MNMVAFHAAFITRLTADTTLVSTYLGSASNIYFGAVPTTADLTSNSLVLNLETTGHTDTGNKDIISAEIEFTINVLKDGAQGPDAALYILDRLYGDGIENAGNVPAYGFHRLNNLALSSPHSTNYKLFGFEHARQYPLDSNDPDLYLAYSSVFTFFIQTL